MRHFYSFLECAHRFQNWRETKITQRLKYHMNTYNPTKYNLFVSIRPLLVKRSVQLNWTLFPFCSLSIFGDMALNKLRHTNRPGAARTPTTTNKANLMRTYFICRWMSEWVMLLNTKLIGTQTLYLCFRFVFILFRKMIELVDKATTALAIQSM